MDLSLRLTALSLAVEVLSSDETIEPQMITDLAKEFYDFLKLGDNTESKGGQVTSLRPVN